ncbi:MAG: endonuclease domain-containing protein [Alphaproteobacteria bacterium]|nr:MAG: endonuclease domain-containing protein [Alphaproteobacteria bacterium]
MRGTTKATVAKARALRRTMSPPEVRLWTILRRQALGVKFRHQHPIGPYSLDFYAPALKLCIEVDGAVHGMGDNPERDERRDAWVLGRGIRTIRIPAEEVMRNLEGVYQLILQGG